MINWKCSQLISCWRCLFKFNLHITCVKVIYHYKTWVVIIVAQVSKPVVLQQIPLSFNVITCRGNMQIVLQESIAVNIAILKLQANINDANFHILHSLQLQKVKYFNSLLLCCSKVMMGITSRHIYLRHITSYITVTTCSIILYNIYYIIYIAWEGGIIIVLLQYNDNYCWPWSLLPCRF